MTLFAQLSVFVTIVPPNMVMAPVSAKCAESDEVPITEQKIGNKVFSVSKTVVHARPEAVWQILVDYANAPRVFPMLKKCQVLEERGSTKVVKHRITPSGPAGTYEYVVEIKESAPHTMEWHRVSGDFKEVDGYWRLEPMDSGHSTLVTYSSYVNGGMFMPQMLIKRQFRSDAPQIMAALRQQAESNANQIANRPGRNKVTN